MTGTDEVHAVAGDPDVGGMQRRRGRPVSILATIRPAPRLRQADTLAPADRLGRVGKLRSEGAACNSAYPPGRPVEGAGHGDGVSAWRLQ